MKKLVLVIITTLLSLATIAQVPQGINFQGVARNANGSVVVNEAIKVQVTIHPNNFTNPAELIETFERSTNNYGVFDLVIGQGTPNTGSLAELDLINKNYVVQVWVHDGNDYQKVGAASPFQSVPYALVAQTAADDFDKDSINEIQSLSISGTTISLSGSEETIDIPADGDADATNEIQDLSFDDATNILTITNNGTATSIDLSKFIDNTDTQLTEAEVQTIVDKNNYLTVEVDGSVENEIQDLDFSTIQNTLSITNNSTATSIDLSKFMDNTDAQKLTINGSEISISNSAETIDLSSLFQRDYGFFKLSDYQTTDIAAGKPIKFDSVVSGNLTIDASGKVTLNGGKKFKLYACIRTNGTLNGNSMNFNFFNVTDQKDIPGVWGINISVDNPSPGTSKPHAFAIIETTKETGIELRAIGNSGVTSIYPEYSYIYIEEIK